MMLKTNRLPGFAAAVAVFAMYAQGAPQLASASQEQASVLIELGQTQLKQQDYRGAISTFTKAVAQSPDSAVPYFNRGLVRFELDDDLGALEDFDDAVQRNPRFAEAYLYRASLFLSLGDQTNGLVDLRQAAELFEMQGNERGYQRSVRLIQHFNPGSIP